MPSMVWPLPCTSLILSSVFSLELSASAAAGCLLLLNQWSAFWCLDQRKLFTKTGTTGPELHMGYVRSPLRCLLLREGFLSSIPLAYFSSLMDLLLYFLYSIWNCISLLSLFYCPNRMKASQEFGLLSVLLTPLCPGLGWVCETIE